ncbi:MAG TPA: hypothetical protein VHN14_10975 [Kofleriaceae bacterium]|jgi:hypothetical protein|nr:hypothetical protein [Kofleriaceae bacterium]
MRFHVTATDPCIILELAARRDKRVCDRRIDIVMRLAPSRIMHDCDLIPRNRHGYAHLEPRAATMMAVRQVDPDMATLDPIIDVLEAVHPASDGDLDGRTWQHAVKRDLDRN